MMMGRGSWTSTARSTGRVLFLVCVIVSLAPAAPAAAQLVRGTVVDASRGQPIPTAAVFLLNRERDHVAIIVADSLGRYVVQVPEAGEYYLVAQRFGYVDMETPLLRIGVERNYGLDLELRPQPLGLEGIEVTVRNEEVVDWLTLEFGVNPSEAFGFRIVQGGQLAIAKERGTFDPTNTLRFLYVPISHAGECVRINMVPRAQRSSGWDGLRAGGFGAAGATPPETRSREDAFTAASAGCGTLTVDDRVIPNELLDTIDMTSIAVVVTLPGLVRMYTYGFNFAFR
jgi:hypothetical protein